MAQANPQTDHGHHGREAHESTLPGGEAAGGDQEIASAEATSSAETKPADAEWGLSVKKEPIARETKIGLVLILVLVCAFSFVLFKRMQEQDGINLDDNTVADSQSKSSKSIPRTKQVGSTVPPDGVGNSNEEVPQLRQQEPRRLDERARVDSWPDNRQAGDRREPENTQLNSGAGSKGSNPFGSRETATHVEQNGNHVTTREQQGQAANPFGSGSGKVENNGTIPARTTGFETYSGNSTDQSPGGTSSPFGNRAKTTVAGGNVDGTATSDEETPRLRGRSETEGLFPGKGGASEAHRRTGYVDLNGENAQDTIRQERQKQAFDSNAGPEHGTKQMEPLDDDKRFGHGTRKERKGFNETESGQFEPRGSGTNYEANNGSIRPNRNEAGNGGLNQRKSTFGNESQDDRRNGFGTRDNGATTQDSHPLESNRSERFGTATSREEPLGKVGSERPTKRQPFGSPDGSGTSYEERPTHSDPQDRPAYYKVRPGDNYWTISRHKYGTSRYFTALARYNRKRIPDPRKMRPGMYVMTPTVAVLRSRNPDLFPQRKTQTGYSSGNGVVQTGFYRDSAGHPLYSVAEGDTLSGIAHKHLGRASRWIQVYEMNKDRLRGSKNLTIGTELRLPNDASRISLVNGHRRFR